MNEFSVTNLHISPATPEDKGAETMTKAQQTAQIIHLGGMKKALEQLSEVIEQQIEKIESRLEDVKEQSDDE